MNEQALLQAAKAIDPDLFDDDEEVAAKAAFPADIERGRSLVLDNLRKAITVYEAEQEPPLTASQLADALGCFWNAALGSAHSSNNGMVSSAISAVVEGVAAVQNRLVESAARTKEATDASS